MTIRDGLESLSVRAKWHFCNYWQQPWLRHYSPYSTWSPAVAQADRLGRQWLAYDLTLDTQKKMARDVLCLWQCGSDPSLAEAYLDWVDWSASPDGSTGPQLNKLILGTQLCEVREIGRRMECLVRMPREPRTRTYVIQDDEERP